MEPEGVEIDKMPVEGMSWDLLRDVLTKLLLSNQRFSIGIHANPAKAIIRSFESREENSPRIRM